MESNDPVSEFLAREQNVLGDLGEDLIVQPELGGSSAENNVTENGFPEGQTLTNGTSAFDLTQFNSDSNLASLANDVENYTTITTRSQSTQPDEEPEKLRKWREQQAQMIALKDEQEEAKKEELRQQAKKELEQFYAKREEELALRKKLNLERQQALTESTNTKYDENDDGAMWERVAKMIEGNNSALSGTSTLQGKSKSTGGHQGSSLPKDTSRMKQLILMYARGGEQNEKSPSPEMT
ncbi:Clathrin light chain [Meloidogyne graminicola]|uniref:Clathrin light chain n=1 Tax=Meloidogyne graminicola TaxID=189291 RepID=A0A8S9ZR02_9BILA|nr:Clathrin light chain [Meloidogyne graminicola]